MKHPNCYLNSDYPRPQLVNPNFLLLDGKWDFAFDDQNIGEQQQWFVNFPSTQSIVVPFAYQTKDSGIEDLTTHPYMWYARKFTFKKIKADERMLLHFEGSDYLTKVWVNGIYVGLHQGGYTRFSFDITDQLDENSQVYIVVRVEDLKEATQPRGKQTWVDQPFGCWYHETSGIWKSVWCEIVHEVYLKQVKITPRIQDYFVEFELGLNRFAPGYALRIDISYQGQTINDVTINLQRRINNIKLDMNNDLTGFRVHYWTPENPELYDVNFSLLKDNKQVSSLGSYFGFRTVHSHKNALLLNNNPYYLKMVLHQGYYRNSGLTAPSTQALIDDLLLAKKLGFNGVRMHQKIEDQRFYYYADILGMIIWCEMPSPYEFKDETIDGLVSQWKQVVQQFYNHPSICAWVPINESWGVPRIVFDSRNQHLAETLYHMTKAFDDTRPTISNDGWEQTDSDIVTLHNYTQKADHLTHFYGDLQRMLSGQNIVDYTQTRLPFAQGYEYKGQPVIISEFAGIGYKNGQDHGWGYGDMVANAESYTNRLAALVKAIRAIDDVCGFCITQLTDVEIEINGLFDIDRKPKAPLEDLIKAING